MGRAIAGASIHPGQWVPQILPGGRAIRPGVSAATGTRRDPRTENSGGRRRGGGRPAGARVPPGTEVTRCPGSLGGVGVLREYPRDANTVRQHAATLPLRDRSNGEPPARRFSQGRGDATVGCSAGCIAAARGDAPRSAAARTASRGPRGRRRVREETVDVVVEPSRAGAGDRESDPATAAGSGPVRGSRARRGARPA